MSNMRYLSVGNTGVHSSILGLGAMTFGEKNVWKLGGLNQKTVNEMVKKAYDIGINFFDTADIYDDGESEKLLGNALKNIRDEILIATKVRGRTGKGINEVGLSRHHIKIAIRKSLERLNTSWVDFYQFHGWDNAVPLEESMEAMQHLVENGNVLYPGISNFSAWQMAYLQGKVEEKGYAKYETAQMNYSLLNRDVEHEVIPFVGYSKMSLLSWSPLHGGILTGKYRPGINPENGSRHSERGFFFPPFDESKGFEVVDKVRNIASEQGVTPAQVALAWLISKKVIVLVGAKTMAQFEENIHALDVNLTSKQLAELDEISKVPKMYPNWMIEGQNLTGRSFTIVE